MSQAILGGNEVVKMEVMKLDWNTGLLLVDGVNTDFLLVYGVNTLLWLVNIQVMKHQFSTHFPQQETPTLTMSEDPARDPMFREAEVDMLRWNTGL